MDGYLIASPASSSRLPLSASPSCCDNELKIKIAHCNTGFALAGRCLLDVPQAQTELEISRLDDVLARGD